MIRPSIAAETAYTIREDTALSAEEREALQGVPFEVFEHYAKFSTKKTRLFLVKVYRDDRFLGATPVIRLHKFQSMKMLRPRSRRILTPLFGLFSRKTTYLIDTAFLAYDYASPFYVVDEEERPAVRKQVSDHLKAKRDVDTVWINEPDSGEDWSAAEGYFSMSILPMVHVDLAGHDSLESFLAAQSKKRRRNFRQDRQAFEEGGGRFEWHEPPLSDELTAEMYACLRHSADRSWICVPYQEVWTGEQAFRSQPQTALVARVGDKMVGFASFVASGGKLRQCHGGLDYGQSVDVKAYHNLISASVEYAIERGYGCLTMGPLNNETKRRAGTDILPMAGRLWCRDTLSRIVTEKLLSRRFQVCGSVPGVDKY